VARLNGLAKLQQIDTFTFVDSQAVTMRLAHGPSKKFRVVCFLEETTKDGRHVVDLVPVNWISFSSENSGLCSYPPPPYTNLINMVKRMNSPGLLWKQYPVRVIGKAGKLV